MAGPNAPLHRVRSAALVAAVAALLASIGTTTVARAESRPAVDSVAATTTHGPAPSFARGWAVIPV